MTQKGCPIGWGIKNNRCVPLTRPAKIDKIVFKTPIDWQKSRSGGHREIYINSNQLKQLLKNKYIDPDVEVNTRSNEPFIEFMKAYPQCEVEVGVPAPDRQAKGEVLSIAAIRCDSKKVTKTMKNDFIDVFHAADDFEHRTELKAWYD